MAQEPDLPGFSEFRKLSAAEVAAAGDQPWRKDYGLEPDVDARLTRHGAEVRLEDGSKMLLGTVGRGNSREIMQGMGLLGPATKIVDSKQRGDSGLSL